MIGGLALSVTLSVSYGGLKRHITILCMFSGYTREHKPDLIYPQLLFLEMRI